MVEFLGVLLVFGLVAAAQYIWGGGWKRKRQPRAVPRPSTGGYRRDSDVNMLLYAVSDPNSVLNEQMPDGARCDDPPGDGDGDGDGDAGADPGDCDPGSDSSDSDSDSGGGDSPD